MTTLVRTSIRAFLVSAVAWVVVSVAAHAETVNQTRFEVARVELLRRVGRPEAVAPLAALLRLDDFVPAGALRAVLHQVADDRRSDPLVAAQAAYHLAVADENGGDAAAGARGWRALGLLDTFQVIGPFDAQGRSGLARHYPPEDLAGQAAMDVLRTARYPGKEREVTWRVADGVCRQGALLLGALLTPDTDAVAYALTFVRSGHAGPAVLRLGSAGPIKVWLNGQVVLDENVVHPPALDQHAAAVTLAAGDNVLLVKTVITAGAWRLFVRFTDDAGRPLPNVAAHNDGAATVRQSVPTPKKAARALGPLLQARAKASRGPARSAAWLDYARLLTLVPDQDADKKAVEGALRTSLDAAESVEALSLLAEVAHEEDHRRAAFERIALISDGGAKAAALAALGDLARSRRRDSLAFDNWRAALAIDPTCWTAALAIAMEEHAMGLPASALARIDALPTETRALMRVRRARLRVLDGMGRKREAEQELLSILHDRRADVETLQDLAGAARNRGDLPAAAGRFEEAAALRPDLSFLAIEAARIREAMGDLPRARKLLEAATARLPDEPRLPEELGKLLARAGQTAVALAQIRRALVLRPQNPTLRHYADRLAALSDATTGRVDVAEDLARDRAEDVEVLAAKVLAMTTGSDVHRDAAAVVLLDRRVVRVHGNGLSETFGQRVVHVRSDRGARENQEFFVRYAPGTQEVEIRKAQILRRAPSGEVEISDATGRDDRDLSEPWYGLYYDSRAQVVVFDGLHAGDILDVEYTVADVSAQNAMADYFGDFEVIGEAVPKLRWDYTLLGPRDRSFFFNVPALAGLKTQIQQRGDHTEYRYAAADIPKVDAEPSMPGQAEVAPYLHVSTYRTWQDVGRWWWHLVADQLVADDDLRRLARDSIVGLNTDDEKVRALHRVVIEGTRYVGLEFGIHGYKPYKVTQVLTRRFGDCKDKASLLHALLREAGIASELVLVRTRRGGRIAPAPASLAVFDHAIVYVPALSLYLDATAEFSGIDELPHQDQGVMVLRVGPAGATLQETPVLPSSANRAERAWSIDLDASGAARVREQFSVKGQSAPDWRQHYQTPGERLERYGKTWSGRFAGATVESLDIDGTDDRNRAVSVRAVVQVPRLGELSADGSMGLPVAAREVDFVRSYARLSARRRELVLAYPWQHQDELVFNLPAGWRVSRAPLSRHEASDFGIFDLQVTPAADGRVITVRSALDVRTHRVTPKAYPAFRAFLGAIDAALGEKIVLVREKASF